LENLSTTTGLKAKVGRKLKVNDWEIASAFIVSYGSMHEKRAFEIRYKRSAWFRFLVDNFSVIGDKAYRGIEKVVISAQKEIKRAKQMIERFIGGTKGFGYSRWRKGITLLP